MAKKALFLFLNKWILQITDFGHWSVDDYLVPGILFLLWFMGMRIFSWFCVLPSVHNSRSFWPNDTVEHGKIAGWWSEQSSAGKNFFSLQVSLVLQVKTKIQINTGWCIFLNFESRDHTTRHPWPYYQLQRLCFVITCFCSTAGLAMLQSTGPPDPWLAKSSLLDLWNLLYSSKDTSRSTSTLSLFGLSLKMSIINCSCCHSHYPTIHQVLWSKPQVTKISDLSYLALLIVMQSCALKSVDWSLRLLNVRFRTRF